MCRFSIGRTSGRMWMLAALTVSALMFIVCDKDDGGEDCPATQDGCPGYVRTVNKGQFTDSRDGTVYDSVRIGSQVWMAENLNYDALGSTCYRDTAAYCAAHGRLYDWATAMESCPVGWHLPSDAEWTQLMDFVGTREGTKLKSTTGWDDDCYSGKSGNGTDDYGFSALPGGDGYSRWWSATDGNSADFALRRQIICGGVGVTRIGIIKTSMFSVRCVAD